MYSSWLLPSWTLLERELVRFFRQPNRVVGALATPLVFWVLIGTGFSSSFRPKNMPVAMTSMEYLFPGVITLMILFTSIFSTVSIIEDRREGFLQSVLVAPVSRGAVVLGKILGGAAVALIQAVGFLLLAPLVGIHYSPSSFALAVLISFMLSFALTGLGFVIVWRMDSVQGFHAVMNLFLMPMWLLSGSFFPASGAPFWLRGLIQINPLTYGVAALRRSLYWAQSSFPWDLPSLPVSLGVTLLFGFFFFIISFVLAEKRKLSVAS